MSLPSSSINKRVETADSSQAVILFDTILITPKEAMFCWSELTALFAGSAL